MERRSVGWRQKGIAESGSNENRLDVKKEQEVLAQKLTLLIHALLNSILIILFIRVLERLAQPLCRHFGLCFRLDFLPFSLLLLLPPLPCNLVLPLSQPSLLTL